MESDVLADVLYDDPSKLSKGTNKEATKQPHKPKKEPKDTTTPVGVSSGLFLMISFKFLLIRLCL